MFAELPTRSPEEEKRSNIDSFARSVRRLCGDETVKQRIETEAQKTVRRDSDDSEARFTLDVSNGLEGKVIISGEEEKISFTPDRLIDEKGDIDSYYIIALYSGLDAEISQLETIFYDEFPLTQALDILSAVSIFEEIGETDPSIKAIADKRKARVNRFRQIVYREGEISALRRRVAEFESHGNATEPETMSVEGTVLTDRHLVDRNAAGLVVNTLLTPTSLNDQQRKTLFDAAEAVAEGTGQLSLDKIDKEVNMAKGEGLEPSSLLPEEAPEMTREKLQQALQKELQILESRPTSIKARSDIDQAANELLTNDPGLNVGEVMRFLAEIRQKAEPDRVEDGGLAIDTFKHYGSAENLILDPVTNAPDVLLSLQYLSTKKDAIIIDESYDQDAARLQRIYDSILPLIRDEYARRRKMRQVFSQS